MLPKIGRFMLGLLRRSGRSIMVEKLDVGGFSNAILAVVAGEDLLFALGLGVVVLDAVESAAAGAEFIGCGVVP